MNRFLFVIILTISFNKVFSQDTLPRFTLIERNNRVTIGWINPYESVIQLNVQRSYDSLINFKTIFSPLSPDLPQNGFTETKMPATQVYYRIFYVLKGGAYFFSRSQRTGAGNLSRSSSAPNTLRGNASGQITVNVKDRLYSTITASNFPRFRDSVVNRTRDTLNAINDSLVVILPYRGPDNFRPSIYIYSIREGVNISLPLTNKKYSVKFFEENGAPLFEIAHIKESQLTLDKANFLHAGWFVFELYEDEVLKEKNRFFLSKEF